MQIRGIRGRLQRRVAGWLGRQAVVLAYHRVTPTVQDDPERLCVSTRHFAEHLRWLADRFELVSASHLGRLLTRPWRGGPYAAVTFDDGYADNLYHALPILESMRVPATVFVASGQVGSDCEFWWDELHRLMPQAPDDETDAPAANAYAAFHQLLKPLPPPQRAEMLARLRVALDVPETPARDSHRALAREELRTLADSPWIEIGAHTIDHVQLAAQDLQEQIRQIHGSIRRLARWTGRAVRSFSYPFGLPADVGPTAVRLVESSGVDVAFGTLAGTVWARSNRWMLPRFLVRDGSTRALAASIADALRGQRHVA